MTESSGGDPPPGWYYASGDPFGTQRWWDGRQWVGGPQWVQQPQLAYRDGRPLPELGRTLAEPGRRIVARIIDALIESVFTVVPVVIWFLQDTSRNADDLQTPPSWFLLGSLFALAYEIGFVAVKGATPGKMAMGIEVIRMDGTAPPGWSTAVKRIVLDLIGVVPGIGVLISLVLTVISFVFLFTDDRRRTLDDRVASTYVVNRTR
jgi:uncharacterized RDD family membrane protein YckC